MYLPSIIECPTCGSKTPSSRIGISAGGLGFGSSRGAFAGVQQTAAGAMASSLKKKGYGLPFLLIAY